MTIGEMLVVSLPVIVAKWTQATVEASATPEEIIIPILWSRADEALNDTENRKIVFAAALCRNATQSLLDLLDEKKLLMVSVPTLSPVRQADIGWMTTLHVLAVPRAA